MTYLRATLILLTVVISGCGFHLRGAGEHNDGNSVLGGKTVYLNSSSRSELDRLVKLELIAAGAVLTSTPNAEIGLTLGAEEFMQRNLSLNARARAAEVELVLSTNFSIQRPSHDLIEDHAIVNRQMFNDPRNILGKTEEIRLFRKEMRREIAAQITRRLIYTLSN